MTYFCCCHLSTEISVTQTVHLGIKRKSQPVNEGLLFSPDYSAFFDRKSESPTVINVLKQLYFCNF